MSHALTRKLKSFTKAPTWFFFFLFSMRQHYAFENEIINFKNMNRKIKRLNGDEKECANKQKKKKKNTKKHSDSITMR